MTDIFGRPSRVRSCCVYGGASKGPQIRDLQDGMYGIDWEGGGGGIGGVSEYIPLYLHPLALCLHSQEVVKV